MAAMRKFIPARSLRLLAREWLGGFTPLYSGSLKPIVLVMDLQAKSGLFSSWVEERPALFRQRFSMNKRSTKIALLALAAGCTITILAGCAEPQPYTYQYPQQPYGNYAYQPPAPQDGVVVDQAPPPSQVEVVPVAPGPAYVWLPGYWSIGVGGGWMWMGGHYAVRPHPHAVWTSGHWDRHGRRYVWRGGHWH